MLSKIKNLKATFEDGKLAVHLDRKTMLELVETQLKRASQENEAGMTATLQTGSSSSGTRILTANLDCRVAAYT